MTDDSNLNCKIYEEIKLLHNPAYKSISFAVELVLKFVAVTERIIYGGTAIDLALRAQGSKLYEDSVRFADVDFYSPDNVNDAYDLVDILKENGFENARCIYGTHVTTMRIDIGDNNWIADISYVPDTQFEIIETLMSDGMRFVHPKFQRIDLHNPFAFPYTDPPMEAIFNRWEKDNKRLGLLETYYPVELCNTKKCTPTDIEDKLLGLDRKYPVTGLLAYEIIYNNYLKIFEKFGSEITHVAPPPKKYVYARVNKDATKSAFAARFREFGTLLSEWYKCDDGFHEIMIGDNMLSVNSHEIGDKHIRYTNIHYLLRMFLASHFTKSHIFGSRDDWIIYYNSLYHMLKQVQSRIFTDNFRDYDNPLYKSFLPSTTVYGYKNVSLAAKVNFNRIFNVLGKVDKYDLPKPYKADGARPPAYEYNCELYKLDGNEIINENDKDEDSIG